MTAIELFEALKAAGVEDDIARRAAHAVLSVEDRAALAMKADLAELKAELLIAIADVKSEMMKMLMWAVGLNVGALVAMTGVFAALVQWLRP
jgi:hypothetical protein